jgi:isoquinoline 1-oxidoreductase
MTAGTHQGLIIQGGAALNFPPPASGYARRAYGDVTPDFGPSPWLVVRPDGSILVLAGKVEYGQGIRWGLAIAAAEELRVPLESVEVVLGDTGRVPWDMGTFGSQSTRFTGVQVRKAAATARQALLELASAKLDLPVDQLRCEGGAVVSASDPTRGVSYAGLVPAEPVVRDIMDDVAVTPADDFTVMGHTSRRPDARARVTGEAIYAQDVARAGMLFAAVLRPPSYGARLVSVDGSAAERMPGVAAVVHEGGLAAVLADTDEHADLGVAVLQAEWEERTGHISQWDLPAALLENPCDPVVIQDEGSLDEGFRASPNVLEATYFIPYVSTVPMEPRAAVAEWDGDRLTVWAGTQRPFGIRSELAAELGIEESQIRVIAPEIGGGFGAKSIYRPAFEAAKLARAAGRPVRVAYTRPEEMAWATFRPAALVTIRSGFDGRGNLLAWDFHAIHTTTDRPMIGQRGAPSPYGAPHTRVVVSSGPAPLRPGSYRSLGGAVNHFARESHIDEIAACVGMDPVELRLENLTDRRYRRVLEAAATQFGWQPAAPGSGGGVGVALGWDVGSYSAECVQLHVQGREVVIDRVSASIDCGLVYNPEGVRNQVEGSIVMGLGTALYEGAEFEGGRLLNGSFARYRVPRIHDVPPIDVVMVGDNDEPPTGAGEPGIVPIAAAIANAVFDATGTRIRELPLQRQL